MANSIYSADDFRRITQLLGLNSASREALEVWEYLESEARVARQLKNAPCECEVGDQLRALAGAADPDQAERLMAELDPAVRILLDLQQEISGGKNLKSDVMEVIKNIGIRRGRPEDDHLHGFIAWLADQYAWHNRREPTITTKTDKYGFCGEFLDLVNICLKPTGIKPHSEEALGAMIKRVLAKRREAAKAEKLAT